MAGVEADRRLPQSVIIGGLFDQNGKVEFGEVPLSEFFPVERHGSNSRNDDVVKETRGCAGEPKRIERHLEGKRAVPYDSSHAIRSV